MAKNVADRILIPAARIDKDALKRQLERIVPVIGLKSRIWVLERTPYIFDFEALGKVVAMFADRLGDNKDLAVRHFWELDSLLRPLNMQEKEEDDEDVVANRAPLPHHFYTTQLAHETTNWPRKDVMGGVIALLGDTRSGKTYATFHTLNPDFVIRYSEPFEDVDLLDRVLPASSMPSVITYCMVLAAMGFNVAVDSLRGLVYSLKGNAMEGGMVATLFDVLVQLNNLLADLGTTAVVSINPMMSDPSKIDRLFARVDASCAGAILVEDRAMTALSFRCTNGRFDSFDGTRPSNAGPGWNDPASTRYRGDGTILGMAALREGDIHDNIAAGYGASPEPEAPSKPRVTPLFNL